jgi:hypothetical protein
MKRREPQHPPNGWTPIGIMCALLGAFFWLVVIGVAWHFLIKYW